MKTKKRVLQRFEYRECDEFAAYLHEQSLAGWHFKGWHLGLIFEKGEPEDIYYQVEVFPKGKDQDMKPEDDTKEYVEYCEAAGWKFIDSQGKFCVFIREKEDAVPIVESKERFCNVKAAEWGNWLRQYGIMFFMVVWHGALGWLASFENVVFENAWIFVCVVCLIASIVGVIEGIWLLGWAKQMKKQLAAGKIPEYRRKTRHNGIVRLFLILVLAAATVMLWIGNERMEFWTVIITMGCSLIIAVLAALLKPSRLSYDIFSWISGFAVIAICIFLVPAIFISNGRGRKAELGLEDIPFSLKDMRMLDVPEDVGGTHRESILGSRTSCYVTCEEDGSSNEKINFIHYDYIESDYRWVLERIWELNEENMEEASDCSEEGYALEARQSEGSYYIKYDDKILKIYIGRPLSAEEIDAVCRKIGVA